MGAGYLCGDAGDGVGSVWLCARRWRIRSCCEVMLKDKGDVAGREQGFVSSTSANETC